MTNTFSYIDMNHLKKLVRLILDLLENSYYLLHADFSFHGCFPFLYKVFGQNLSTDWKSTLFSTRSKFAQQIVHSQLYRHDYLLLAHLLQSPGIEEGRQL